ncbi:P-loop containing nucleoside triphosphate hydrolase [Pseudocohnilembus persalinus]|uniref:p-loop containing nucleoside triphosphate hydrolase n=1 Tax=Pseudocohnilembus persalinus TaxID=266149 RepID=A0A0V0QE36_PSEPJ|nr:P-loop containing nucleoside triphosphate hydrolase [Pseudocohnilembus persalinus]|eukprot:KRX00474.1 P-loop containing nucleoside triphosphate hydrolase [Pseudocohnilembus persalinus]
MLQDTQDKSYFQQYKIILLGNSHVGKSSILTRFTKDEFHTVTTSTQGQEFASKNVEVEGKIIKAQIWDTAGQEKFQAMANIFYKGAVGALITYDITDRESFEKIDKWYQELKTYSEKNFIVIMLVGNKSDMNDKRQVSKDEGVKWAEQNKMGFFETSAKDGSNIEFTFQKLIEQIYGLMVKKSQISEVPQQGMQSVIIDHKTQKAADDKKQSDKKKKKCCTIF